MSKLFIFAIGGTGSRVIKSLTMLLASGVEMKNVSEIIPIIVDPHKSNDDLKRTESILKTYKKIRDHLPNMSKDNFFGTEIKTLKSIIPHSGNMSDTYTFELKGVTNETFGNYIDYDTLDKNVSNSHPYSANRALADLLFSTNNLETEMDIGFVGNPNIGSVVLNQFKESEEFKQFAANFAKDDKIFIISSIFGGTGAAGFPIILKNIRGAEAGSLANPEYLKNAKIGALTVLPYFGIEPNDEKTIDKATFYSKTKAALHYYTRGVNRSVNKLYYIGDELTQNYKYDPGGNGQKNDAHFVEMAGAMAIVDFAATDDRELDNHDYMPTEPIYCEFGIRNDRENLDFSDLDEKSQKVICRHLTKMTLLNLYIQHRIDEAVGQVSWLKDSPSIDGSFLHDTFFKTYLSDFKRAFFDWLQEMARNKRGFTPFRLQSDLNQVIVGFEQKKGWFGSTPDFKHLDDILSAHCRRQSFSSSSEKFVMAFSKGADKFLTDKFPELYKNI